MILFILILATFAAGNVLGAFFMLLVGIRSEEHNNSLKDAQTTPTNAATQKVLGVYVRTRTPDRVEQPTDKEQVS